MFEYLKKHKGSFTPEELTVLNSALDEAWRAVAHQFDEKHTAAAREMLAKRIIEKAQTGRLDQRRLAREATDHLATSFRKENG